MIPVFWLRWVWPTIILLSAVAVGLVTFAFPDLAVRPIVVMWFLFVCPGMTVVRFFRLAEIVIEWMLAIALSFAIDACVAGMILYAGWWSPARILSILIGFCLIGVSMQFIVMRFKERKLVKPERKVPSIVPTKEQEDLDATLRFAKKDRPEDQDATLCLIKEDVLEDLDATLQLPRLAKEDRQEDRGATPHLTKEEVSEDQDATLRFAKKDMKNIKVD